MVREKCEWNMKTFRFGKRFSSEITTVSERTQGEKSLSNISLAMPAYEDAPGELHLLLPRVRCTLGSS